MNFKIKNSFIAFLLICMVNLVLQPTVLSLNKTAKSSKSSSALNTPFAEEEENHSGKESPDDLIFFPENPFRVYELQHGIAIMWPTLEDDCLFHTSEILIPPPKI